MPCAQLRLLTTLHVSIRHAHTHTHTNKQTYIHIHTRMPTNAHTCTRAHTAHTHNHIYTRNTQLLAGRDCQPWARTRLLEQDP